MEERMERMLEDREMFDYERQMFEEEREMMINQLDTLEQAKRKSVIDFDGLQLDKGQMQDMVGSIVKA